VLGRHHYCGELLRSDNLADFLQITLARKMQKIRRHQMIEQDKKHGIDTSENRSRLQAEMFNHVGKVNAISMTALYEVVFDRPWNDKINDTRALRTLITALRDEGVAICSSSSQNDGGYYIPAAGSEYTDYLRKRKIKALIILKQNSKAEKVSLPAYLGQLQLEMEAT
jgi:hypothetical protein